VTKVTLIAQRAVWASKKVVINVFLGYWHIVLVYCLVNRFRKQQDLWRPPKLCGFC